MKIITLDEYEFETSSSEEFLVIAIGKSNQYKDVKIFFEDTKRERGFVHESSSFDECIKFKEYPYFSRANYYLDKFTGRSPSPEAAVIELYREWDEQDILIESMGVFREVLLADISVEWLTKRYEY